MPNTHAIVIADRQQSRMGLPSHLADLLGGKTVLQRTVNRLEQIKSVKKIIIVHPADQDLSDIVSQNKKPLIFHKGEVFDKYTALRQSARKWAMNNWRGGLGGMTCYDELLPVKSIYEAVIANKTDAAIIVGGDWPLVDPTYCQKTLDIHLEHPDDMQMTFNQSPPGLSGIVICAALLKQMAENEGATLGSMLAYVPSHPQADPIGRDICYAIEPVVRNVAQRLIYDNDRSIAMINALDVDWAHATAAEIATALKVPNAVPSEVHIELTTQRVCKGPLMPQHYVDLDREPMSMEVLEGILKQLPPMSLITFGGLGDAMLYEHWVDAIKLAKDCGVFGICIKTDLQGPMEDVDKLLHLPVDIVAVHLNADTAQTYTKLCAPISDEYNFKHVTDNLQWMINERNRRWQLPDATTQAGVPWVVPHLIKTAENLKDMETFFDRWMHYTHQAVILPAQSGCGLMPELSPVRMAPPTRFACRQLSRRLTIHSDGKVAQCDQDWLAKAPLGDLSDKTVSLPQLWENKGKTLCAQHAAGEINSLELCSQCHEWHRP
ncbi:MAG: SPASM domain-containing protein [Phycisphaeraceae bacterium JB051]